MRAMVLALSSALLIAGSVPAHAEESTTVTLSLDVTGEPEPDPCMFAPISPSWSPSLNSGGVVEAAAGGGIFDVVLLGFTPGSDACGETVAQDGTVQASFEPTPFVLENPELQCSDAPCDAALTGGLDVRFDVPPDTPTGTYTIDISVTWTPIS